MESIFLAFDLSTVLPFVISTGLIIVGITLAFRGIDFVNRILYALDSDFRSDVDATISEYSEHSSGFDTSVSSGYEWVNPDFNPDIDFDAESRFDAVSDYLWAERDFDLSDPDQLAHVIELRGGLSREEYFEQNQEHIARFMQENPEDTFELKD